MTETKQSAIEAAANAMDRAQDSFFETIGFETTPPSEFKKRLAQASILAYLSAIAEDDASVEACKEAIVKEMDNMAAVYGADARMFDLNALRVKAVVSTLLERAKEGQG